MKFSTVVYYGDLPVTVEADNLSEFHQAVAGLQELNNDCAYLVERVAPERITFRFYIDSEGNEYYGFQAPDSRRNITFGKNREKQVVPFFPKGEEGFYAPDSAPSSGATAQWTGSVDGVKKQNSPAQPRPSMPPTPPVEAYEEY